MLHVIGWTAVALILAAVVVVLVPVDNPGVQSCGTPAAFALDGRPDVYPDAGGKVRRSDGSIDTLTKAEIDRAYDQPCTDRVGARLVPAGIALVAGTLLGVVALGSSMVSWWRRAARAVAHRPPPAG